MPKASVLAQLVDELNAGKLEVIDLTQTLSSDTPVIGLPPIFGASPGFSTEVISKYDDKGPAWYWSTIRLGEHTGTHFDAPVHWVTGKDLPANSTDTIPAARCVGPACVIDVSRECAADPDFLLSPQGIQAWEAAHGRIPAGAWVLLRTDWSKRSDPAEFLNIGGSSMTCVSLPSGIVRSMTSTRPVARSSMSCVKVVVIVLSCSSREEG